MKTLFTTLCLLINSILFSQIPEIEWTKNYGGSGAENLWGSVLFQQTTDGGYILAAGTTSNDHDVSENHGDQDFWIVKMNETRDIEWEKSYGGSDYDGPYSIVQTADGGYIAAGVSVSTDGDVTDNHGASDYWVIKVDEAGAIEWKKSYGGSGMESATRIQQTPDGGYFVAGSSSSSDGDVVGNDNGILSYWVIKINEGGDLEWSKFYDGEHSARLYDFQMTSAGGYICVGTTSYFNPMIGFIEDMWVVKASDSGEVEWEQLVVGNDSDYADAVRETADGGYIIAGYNWSSDIINNQGEGDAWLVKLDPAGEVEWMNSYGGSFFDEFSSVEQMPDGGYLCLGVSDSLDGDVSENLGMRDYWLVRVDSEGNLLWEKSFGGSLHEETYSDILITEDGSYLIAGNSESSDGDVPGNYGGYDIWIMKLSVENMGTTEFENQMILYPNPTTGIINLQSEEKINSVLVYNVTGQRMSINSLNKDNTSIDISSLPDGTYFVEVTLNNNKTIKRYKIIKK